MIKLTVDFEICSNTLQSLGRSMLEHTNKQQSEMCYKYALLNDTDTSSTVT